MATAYAVERDLEITKEPFARGVVDPIILRRGEHDLTDIVGHLSSEGSPFSATGYRATFRAYNARREWVVGAVAVSGTDLTYTVDSDLTAYAGDVSVAYFELARDGGIVTTEAVPIYVADNVDLSEAEATGYRNALDRLLEEMDDTLALWDEQIKGYERAETERQAAFERAEEKRQQGEDAREDAEQGRAAAEQQRQGAETAREEAETQRATAETLRDESETAREAAEDAREAAEEERASSETARRAAEQERDAAETLRDDAERARAEAEDKRATAETARDEAETSRAEAETGRVEAETKRSEAEDSRAEAETGRATAETERETAESLRSVSEETRQAQELLRQSAEDSRRAEEAKRAEAEAARKQAEAAREAYAAKLKSDVDSGAYDGATFTPSVSAEGVLSWTNDKGRENPPDANVRGPKGDTGPGLVVLDTYETSEEFLAAHPSGTTQGEAYVVAGSLWIWNGEEWRDTGASVGGGGGGAGPLWLEVDEAGDLWAYYDDAVGPPTVFDYDEDTGDLYSVFETAA